MIYPFVLHSLSLSIFSSVIGPFGGFFASGFKRAFKIKVIFSVSLSILVFIIRKSSVYLLMSIENRSISFVGIATAEYLHMYENVGTV